MFENGQVPRVFFETVTYPYKKRRVGGKFMSSMLKLGGFEVVIGIAVVIFLVSIVIDDGFE
ncbi:hypothetical protein C4A75_20335 [Brevibacillus laterosporus]|nr:hypothetical protein BrL25_05855 [Brevibacillus laterosporus DSM 25]MBG9773335.1 hypothetical protein [Brevibacillus laterosporus]MBG9787475.1 hypothetical protein [Brevibacillus laterosporus]MBG9796586.1 hypothetical protein [Brevibacillus laterosporus]MBG9800861.1 hypothetical protein [Brevibacillus laterosporus]